MLTPTDSGSSLGWAALWLQTSDALFPTGAYAHSLGFEESVRLGLAHDERSLLDFLREHVSPALTHFELPYLRFAFEAASANDFGELATLDAELGAGKLAAETREASVQLGGRRLKALRVILPEDARLAECERLIAVKQMAGHQAVICGVQAAAAEIPLPLALTAYHYQSLAGVAGAALKLIRIGQDGVQRALRTAAKQTSAAVEHSLTVPREKAGWFGPLLEIAGMRHADAAERLFIS